ncbi:MAG TPA: SymE family type I addiction module toxin [Thermoanaerobaculia bacterium]|nr:SymE family type I addiction module toxin [Thermoanaerobaculia bacterium]
MLKPDIAERIRAIFADDESAVTIVDFIILLGWSITTFDNAVKWRLVTFEDASGALPRISRAQLRQQARDQWSEAEIAEALGPAAARALVAPDAAPVAASRISDSVRVDGAASPQVVTMPSAEELRAAGLRPPHREPPPRRRSRSRVLAAVPPPPPPPARRNRADGVHEATMITACAGDNGSAPHLRLRGHWLARFGFKPDARIYITPSLGQLVITLTDPAAVTAMADRSTARATPRASRS